MTEEEVRQRYAYRKLRRIHRGLQMGGPRFLREPKRLRAYRPRLGRNTSSLNAWSMRK